MSRQQFEDGTIIHSSSSEEACSNSNKPPLGLVPRVIRQESRAIEISNAISRYMEVFKPIPATWLREYNELASELGDNWRK